jgi:hypothetical protein
VASTPTLRGERISGLLLWRAGPAAAIAVAAIGLAAAVLVPVHLWQPLVALPVLLVLAVAGWRVVRLVPAKPAPVWATAVTVLLALCFAVWAGWTHSEQVVLRRDGGTYALFAQWLATRHGLPVDAHLPAFGGPAALGVPGFTLASPGFFQAAGAGGATVLPQFLLGAPAAFSIGWWATGGWDGLFLVPAVLGGLGLLAAGGVAARIVGPRWAPLAVAALGLTQPVLHAARTTFSEPPALVLVLGAAAVAVDAVERDRADLGALAGALAGLAGIVRVDSLREVALLVPACLLLALRGSRAAVPMAAAALLSSVAAAVPAALLSRPYLRLVAGSLVPLIAGAIGLTVLSLGVLILARRRHQVPVADVGLAEEMRLPDQPRLAERVTSPAEPAPPSGASGAPGRPEVHDRRDLHDRHNMHDRRGLHDQRERGRWAPVVVGGLVAAVGLLLASRPWWSVVRQSPDDPAVGYLASLQRQQGLPVDGTQTYAEQSLTWVAWYVGPVAIVLAWAALVVASARATGWWLDSRPRTDGGRAVARPGWLIPTAVGLGSTVLTLYRPGITPDHPWADRRLVVTVLPTIVLAAVAAVALLVRAARRRAPAPILALTAVAGIAALLVPAGIATVPVAAVATERGEPAAAAAVCHRLQPQDVVVALGGGDRDGGSDRSTNEWPPVVRGVCGHPSAVLLTPAERVPASLDRLAAMAARAGGRLVVLAAVDGATSPPPVLTRLGLHPVRAVTMRTTEDPRWLTRPARGVVSLPVEVWIAPWADRTAG